MIMQQALNEIELLHSWNYNSVEMIFSFRITKQITGGHLTNTGQTLGKIDSYFPNIRKHLVKIDKHWVTCCLALCHKNTGQAEVVSCV